MTATPPFRVTVHGAGSPDLLAALHRASFEKCWTAAEFAELLAADEAEILTLAVNADWRRAGIATCLIKQALDECTDDGIRHVFLEVADDNIAAINCYHRCGFVDIVRRPGYYGASGRRIDAIVMRCAVADRAGYRLPGAR